MPTFSKDDVLKDLCAVLQRVRDDRHIASGLGEHTRLFHDLDIGSIEAVALGALLEEHYRREFPFAAFLMQAGEERADDITVGRLRDFLWDCLNGTQAVLYA
jgi:acyl carrier protein